MAGLIASGPFHSFRPHPKASVHPALPNAAVIAPGSPTFIAALNQDIRPRVLNTLKEIMLKGAIDASRPKDALFIGTVFNGEAKYSLYVAEFLVHDTHR
jgi:hypothetical protein